MSNHSGEKLIRKKALEHRLQTVNLPMKRKDQGSIFGSLFLFNRRKPSVNAPKIYLF